MTVEELIEELKKAPLYAPVEFEVDASEEEMTTAEVSYADGVCVVSIG